MKDGSGQAYSIPLYSTIKIGMIQDTLADTSEKHPTVLKTTKVADILTMKVCVCMCVCVCVCVCTHTHAKE